MTYYTNNDKISDSAVFEQVYAGSNDGTSQPSSKTVFDKNHYTEYEYSGYSPLFRTFTYKKDFVIYNSVLIPTTMQFEKRANQTETYKKITSNGKDTVVIMPTFTISAYKRDGFYYYYYKHCDTSCLTTKIIRDNGLFTGSSNAVKILSLLNYTTITDIDVDKNPKILSKYDKVIVLHNEYVTQKEFDAITKHPHVLYLYPNALYAKISVNYQNYTITLIRGHAYPDKKIANGFDWKYDNSKFEYDETCANWKFTKIPNGKMLNCYPENIIFADYKLLKYIRYN